MKLETFFEKFDRFADAPDAVAKMRELVLEVAAQGKLVDQDPDEGDGFELLRRIHQKKPPIRTKDNEDVVCIDLPNLPRSWASSELGEVTEIIRGVSFPGSAKTTTRSKGDVACLRTASVQAEIDWNDLIYISPAHVGRLDQWVAPNDIMISMANSYALVGKVAIVREIPQKATFGAFLAAIRTVLIEPYFLLYVLRSPRMQAAFRQSSSQTTNIANISLGRMRPLPFPLPPLAEQKRIVAKVDELMELCDRLEARQQERETRHTALARASLARFSNAPTSANLKFLFHNSYNITPADLRKSILTLAVQGKLVPQDPSDELAKEFVMRIVTQHSRTSASVRSRKTTLSIEISRNEIPFEIPDSWVWSRLETAAVKITDGEHLSPVKTSAGMPLLTATHVTSKGVTLNNPQYVSVEDGYKSRQRCDPTRGDILICSRGTIGRCAIVDTDKIFCLMGSVILVRFPAESSPKYFNYFLSTDLAQTEMRGMSGATAVQALYLKDIRQSLVPIPPLAEQRRIVAKVDELMALVDALENQLATAGTAAVKLMEAVVAELTAAA